MPGTLPLFAIAAWCALNILSVLDVISTAAFLKAGTGYEANVLDAWLQRAFPASWGVIKGAAFAILTLQAGWLPEPYALVALFALCVFYTVIVTRNFAIAEDGG